VYAFSRLYQTLDQTTSTNAKVAAMVDYFRDADPRDAAWAVYFLSGRRIKRLVGSSLLRQWLTELSELPGWLVEDTYASVGDMAETIALLLTRAGDSTEQLSLAEWVETRLLPLRGLDADAQRAIVTGWWAGQSYEQCYIVTKLLTGSLRVGVSQVLLARAIAQTAELPRQSILHRLMGEWQATPDFYRALIAEDDGEAALSRPYPFCLAAPLDDAPGLDSADDAQQVASALGSPHDWQAEWKWDGIRSQLVRRQGQTFLWSRGEELIGTRFPEVATAAERLPDGCVLDGEILPWNEAGILPFAQLQRRIGRKTVGRKLLNDVPCVFLAYDLLEQHGEDIRERPMHERRERLETLVAAHGATLAPGAAHTLRVSERVIADDWASLATLRAGSRERLVEGLMLKRRDSPYGTGRQRGLWWKWKIEPHTVDAVMLYAQAGHGRRSNLFTDYTFGVWDGDTLVPFAKAYSGLNNKEIDRLDKWIRRNTLERFGPVRSVKLEQVFELAFEGINRSTRHKSGIAVRFPRIVRWREDLGTGDADTLDDVKRLIEDGGDGADAS